MTNKNNLRFEKQPAQPDRLIPTCWSVVMPAPTPGATPVRAANSALVHVLEAYIETLKAENEILKRRLAAAEARAAERERCPWWCRRPTRFNANSSWEIERSAR